MKWNSFHIFYHDQNRWDHFLIYLYKRLIDIYGKNTLPSFFFIRYWEGGPHLRFRVRNMGEINKDKFVRSIADFFLEFPSEIEVNKSEFYNQYQMLLDNHEDREWYPNHSIQELAYIPETRRYNGETMLQLSESQFEFSSRYVIKFLEVNNPDLKRKYNHGLYILSYMVRSMKLSRQLQIDFLRSYCIATLQTYVPEEIEKYLQSYRLKLENNDLGKAISKYWSNNSNILYKQYTNFTEQIIESVKQNNFVFNDIKLKSIEELDVYSHAIIQLYWSWIHMFLNRLGVSPLMEAELTFLLSNSLNTHPIKEQKYEI
ncbi:lantibiotic dehydratase C-terminal domain-containing protein [Virgibacillus sediminis]|uniref:Lantibiotic dehydratase C-terminal domain-containing protein n=1 Tax=Virgibacillus sediminis TaxID=202260 RepID=A0ABV7AAK3_9BACI